MSEDYKHTEAEAHRICADMCREALEGKRPWHMYENKQLPYSSVRQLERSMEIHRERAR